uniref:Uncharacterized protein n=1 Tax=Globodera rostochiensis TaxID=31243 RepID=A0A914IFP3_GLORO
MSSGLSPVPSHFLIFGISYPINDNLAKIMSTSAFQLQTIRLPMALLLILLVLLAISTPNALGNPIAVRDMDEVDEPHAFQAVEKRRNAEFINGLLTMERLNAIGKRSPPVPDVDEIDINESKQQN